MIMIRSTKAQMPHPPMVSGRLREDCSGAELQRPLSVSSTISRKIGWSSTSSKAPGSLFSSMPFTRNWILMSVFPHPALLQMRTSQPFGNPPFVTSSSPSMAVEILGMPAVGCIQMIGKEYLNIRKDINCCSPNKA